MNKRSELIRNFLEAIFELSKVNRLTGIWDNRRFQECKKEFKDVNYHYLYKSEKMSRRNVELRAVYRAQIDVLFEALLRG